MRKFSSNLCDDAQEQDLKCDTYKKSERENEFLHLRLGCALYTRRLRKESLFALDRNAFRLFSSLYPDWPDREYDNVGMCSRAFEQKTGF